MVKDNVTLSDPISSAERNGRGWSHVARVASDRISKEAGASRELSQNSAMAHMDMMRGLSALAVLVGHVRPLFFVNRNELSTPPSRVVDAMYFLTGFGHQAVIVFFVLSGFLIGTSVLGSHRRGTWSWERYLLRRLTRLELVLLPALLLTTALDLNGMHFFGTNNAYNGQLNPAMLHHAVRESLSVGSFLGNLTFLQQCFGVHPYGSNIPLWSLGYEFWSYILFPLTVVMAAGASTIRTRATALLITIAIVASGGVAFLAYFGIWLIGVAACVSWQTVGPKHGPSAWLLLASGGGLVCAHGFARTHQAWSRQTDYLSALATALFVLVLFRRGAYLAADKRRTGYAATAVRLAGLSYTLYLVHYPIAVLLSAMVVGNERWQPTGLHLLLGVAICAAIVTLSHGLAAVTERHTQSVREHALGLLAALRTRFGPAKRPEASLPEA